MVFLRAAKPFIRGKSSNTCTKPVLSTTYGVLRGLDGIFEVLRG